MKKTILIFTIIFSYVLNAIGGGPWTQSKSKGYFKLSEWWTVFDQHYTDTGLTDPNVTTGVFNTSLYAEYGFSDKFTVIFNGSLFSRNLMNNLRSGTTNDIIVSGEAINGLGDIDLGLKYSLSKNGAKIPIALSVVFGLPTGKTSGGTFNNLQTGDGEFNQMIQLDAGKGFNIGKSAGYFSTYIAMNNRTNEFSEEIRYGLEFGIGLANNKLWLSSKLNVVESLKNGATAESVSSTSIFANNTEFASIGFEANYYVTDKLGISIGTAGAFRGEIIAAAPSYSVGIFYDMK